MFKVNDRVYCSNQDLAGTVSRTDCDCAFPIEVTWDGNTHNSEDYTDTETYTRDGRVLPEFEPTLKKI